MPPTDSSYVASAAESGSKLNEAALALARRLHELLENEFEALKSQRLDRFEGMQASKEAVLHDLWTNASARRSNDVGEEGATWANFKDLIRRCRDAHRRNETLIRHQLTAIQGALQALTDISASGAGDLYDRTGKISARLGSITDGSG